MEEKLVIDIWDVAHQQGKQPKFKQKERQKLAYNMGHSLDQNLSCSKHEKQWFIFIEMKQCFPFVSDQPNNFFNHN